MKYKLNLRHIWLAVGILSLVLPFFLPSDAGADNVLLNVIGIVNIAMFVLSLPCGVFGLPIVFLAWYELGMNPHSVQGAYLNTILFFILGFVQWFWIARVWSPTEPVLQELKIS